jgi:hypothetical protein
MDGLRGFYFGLVSVHQVISRVKADHHTRPTLLRAFPTNAAAYFAYESVLRILGAEQARLPAPVAMTMNDTDPLIDETLVFY